MPRVLLVEDDRSLGRTLAERLEKEGLEVQWVDDAGVGARRPLNSGPWDLAILDVMLPDGSGFDLAPEIRQRSRTPIMFMTALNSAESRLDRIRARRRRVSAEAVSPEGIPAARPPRADHAAAAAPPAGRQRRRRLGCDGDRSPVGRAHVPAGAGLPGVQDARRGRAARGRRARRFSTASGARPSFRRSERSTTRSCGCARRSAMTTVC